MWAMKVQRIREPAKVSQVPAAVKNFQKYNKGK